MKGSGMAPVRYEVIQLKGGLDLITPTLSLPPGFARNAQNFEVNVTGGYTRVAGYERYDGTTLPSTAVYSILPATIPGAVTIDAAITGLTSGATGVIIYAGVDYLVVTKQVGTFIEGEDIDQSGVIATVAATTTFTSTSQTNAQYLALAADLYRQDVGAVPGSGAILGVALYNDDLYAWRNNAGGTAADMYKATGSGWTQVTFGYELSFDAGLVEITDGASISNGSGATGTVARVVKESGSWGSTAAGRLILSATSGTWAASDTILVSATPYATAQSAATAITLLPSGKFQTINANFGGTAGALKMYGCDTANRGFEFDGTTMVPIATGMAIDKPKFVVAHKNHLFFTFGASLQHSAIGNPYSWSPLLGASEIALGEDISGLLVQPGSQSGGALGIWTRSNTHMLYGSSSSDWQLTSVNTGVGAIPYTCQNMLNSYVLDDRGIMSMSTSLNYGNFDVGSLTANIRPFIRDHRIFASASAVNRTKSQFRVYFSDGWGLHTTILNDQYLGSMPVLFPDPVRVICAGEDSSGQEVAYFGSDSGYVFKMESGASFDGANISASCTLAFDAIGSPRVRKRYRRASLEVTGNTYCSIEFGYQLGYNSSLITQPASVAYGSSFSASLWDSFVWDNFYWDGITLAPTECEMAGTAENVALVLASNSNQYEEFTINSVILHYSSRRGIR